ncbi:hypothetical protein RDWZM_010605 [Blomia tropicalis]|uniref:Uncharacterized protein n=1 Tax=Blomia tropicalis TaxID=40697 RepID=A0A9Q0LYU0_BLOTA|nr:hypothetical protein RDWZM_010605 [Blomia tropicalis]
MASSGSTFRKEGFDGTISVSVVNPKMLLIDCPQLSSVHSEENIFWNQPRHLTTAETIHTA